MNWLSSILRCINFLEIGKETIEQLMTFSLQSSEWYDCWSWLIPQESPLVINGFWLDWGHKKLNSGRVWIHILNECQPLCQFFPPSAMNPPIHRDCNMAVIFKSRRKLKCQQLYHLALSLILGIMLYEIQSLRTFLKSVFIWLGFHNEARQCILEAFVKPPPLNTLILWTKFCNLILYSLLTRQANSKGDDIACHLMKSWSLAISWKWRTFKILMPMQKHEFILVQKTTAHHCCNDWAVKPIWSLHCCCRWNDHEWNWEFNQTS